MLLLLLHGPDALAWTPRMIISSEAHIQTLRFCCANTDCQSSASCPKHIFGTLLPNGMRTTLLRYGHTVCLINYVYKCKL